MAEPGRDQYSTISFWDELVHRGPATALDTVNHLVSSGRIEGDAIALAQWAVGRSLFELGRIEEAATAARRGLATSANAEPDVRRWIAMTASMVLAEAGQIDEALASLFELAIDLDGVETRAGPSADRLRPPAGGAPQRGALRVRSQ